MQHQNNFLMLATILLINWRIYMPVSTVQTDKTVPYTITINGEALFGIMSNVTIDSEAGQLTAKELNKVLFSGMHKVQLVQYVKKTRDFSARKAELLGLDKAA
jgi:hypothetical protein